MKIFFSPLFDQETYPFNIFMQDGVAIGNKHMGPLALFEFLELHLGLPNSCTNNIDRIFNYRENLRPHAKGSFYERSFKSNDLEVAIKLLQWRDELKMAGWNFKTGSSCPVRLKDLAKAEHGNIGDDTPERFYKIIQALKDKPTLPLDEIIVHEPLELLPSHFTKLFAMLAAAGVTIIQREIPVQNNLTADLDNLRSFVSGNNSEKGEISLKGDGSIQVLRFGDILSAGESVAALLAADSSFKPVVLNETGDISLSLALSKNGLPCTGQAMQSAAHPDLQLLALIPVWLWKPYNPQQILDFFLSPLNIFPKGLSANWMGLFSEHPGINIEDWMKQIDKFVTKFNSEKDKPKHMERLQFILNVAEERNKKISIEDIINTYNFFYTIFNKRCAVTADEAMKSRLLRLCNAFKEFISVLQLAPEKELDANNLQKLLLLVLRPVSVIPFKREAGSLQEISSAGLIVGDCDELLWYGFTANKTNSNLSDEYTIDETNWLKNSNVFPDTATIQGKRDFWYMTQWLRFVKKRLILVIPSVVDGEAAQPHPFHAFLTACFKNIYAININVEDPGEMHLLNNNPNLTEKVNISTIPSYPEYWQINAGLLMKREEESFSSLENLLKYPYRWVLSYKAELYRGQTFGLPANFMFYGTLSHKIFQELFLMPDIFSASHAEIKKRYDITAGKFIDQKGLLLHRQGEESTLKIFRDHLFNKFLILLKHLKDNSWEVDGCEIKGSGKVGDETIGGYCDLLLSRVKNKRIEKAIVDLKYSGRVKYRKLMEDGADLQLAIYSKIYHPIADFCATSYFIILDGLLFTTCHDAFTRGIILRQDSLYSETYGDILKRIENTIKFRRNEFDQGKIEVGEEICVDDLDVFKLDESSYIIPGKKDKSKILSLYNDYKTFIDTE